MIRARGVAFAFPHRARALDGVDLDLHPGELVVLLGPNGAGKSTLLRVLSGELAPSRGSVDVEERPASAYPRRELARRIAVVPQETLATFAFTVGELVLMGRAPRIGRFALESEADVRAAEEALRALDLWELRDRPVGEVSGGERRRAAIARALAQETPALLLDEPTAFLDVRHQIDVFRLLDRLRRERGRAILAVSHDVNTALQLATRVVLLKGGRVAASGSPEETLRPELIREVFETDVEVLRSASGRAFVAFVAAPEESRNQQPLRNPGEGQEDCRNQLPS